MNLPQFDQLHFVLQLFDIMTNATEEDCIKWGSGKDTILVTDPATFAANVLPRYFKHDNIRSFIRQLNIYGFQRCRNTQPPEKEGMVELEFYHESFIEGRKDLMRYITRGIASQKRGGSQLDPPHYASDTTSLLREMRYVQENMLGVDDQMRAQLGNVNSKMSALSELIGISLMEQAAASPGFDHGGAGTSWGAGPVEGMEGMRFGSMSSAPIPAPNPLVAQQQASAQQQMAAQQQAAAQQVAAAQQQAAMQQQIAVQQLVAAQRAAAEQVAAAHQHAAQKRDHAAMDRDNGHT